MTHHAIRSVLARQRGLSLIELMIAIFLSSLLMLGVIQLFTNTSASDRTNSDLARVQESGRVALELITREVRRVGYQGCVSSTTTTNAGSITYPDDALSSGAATTLTLNYARPAFNDATTFPNKDCDNNDLDPYQVTFSNCGRNLCISATDIGNNQELTANTQIANINYGVVSGNNLLWKDFLNMESADWKNVRRMQITLTVTNANADISRNFTSIIELRNRL